MLIKYNKSAIIFLQKLSLNLMYLRNLIKIAYPMLGWLWQNLVATAAPSCGPSWYYHHEF
jgi:hypothetical protein